MCHSEFDRLLAEDTGEMDGLVTRRTEPDAERVVVLRAHYSGAISLELFKEEQTRIESRLDDIKERLSVHQDEYAAARANLDDCLALLANVALIYRRRDIQNRRLCNQAFFRKILIDEDGTVRVDYQAPYNALCDVRRAEQCPELGCRGDKDGEVQTSTRVISLVEG